MTDSNDARALALEITECPVVRLSFAGLESGCSQIVRAQRVESVASFQVPEPWSGLLETAPLLFLSSNPSIGRDEEYPTGEWSASRRCDFFQHRFDQQRSEPWVDNHMRARKRAGLPPPNGPGTRFWLAVRARAHELLDDPTPGVGYVLSEVVHCKSAGQEAVHDAFDTCVNRWLLRVLRTAAARVIVAMGTEAARALHNVSAAIPYGARLTGPLDLEGRERLVAQLPHPNAHVARINCAPLLPEELALVRSFLATR